MAVSNNNNNNYSHNYYNTNTNNNNQRQQLSQERAVSYLVNSGLKRPKIIIQRGQRGFGFVLRAIKVYLDDTSSYTIQHIVIQIDEDAPAFKSGLRVNDIITHVNDEIVCGKMHTELVRLIMQKTTLCLNTVQLNQSNVKTNGGARRRYSPIDTNNSNIKNYRFARPHPFSNNNQQQQFKPVKTYYFKTSQTNGSANASSNNVNNNGGNNINSSGGGGSSGNQRRSIGPCIDPLPIYTVGGGNIQYQPSSEHRKKKTLLRKVNWLFLKKNTKHHANENVY